MDHKLTDARAHARPSPDVFDSMIGNMSAMEFERPAGLG